MKSTIDNKVLSLLKKRGGGWVSTVALARHANTFALHSSISRLRNERGYRIDSRASNDPNKKHWYMLEPPL